jgi:tetratricopeptide (TPR) repeat protein
MLADKRMLVVLDNARDTAQVRPLLPGALGCLVLVTSRNDLSSLVTSVGARPLALDLLTAADARGLLTARIGVDRIAAEPDAVDRITTACARLPLALAVVAARAATHSHLSLAALAAELTEARLDALGDADDPATDIRAVFSWSYRSLTPEAAGLFRLLGLHPGPDVSAAAAASLAGLPPARVQPLLVELARTHLIKEHTVGRYSLHDLLRAYAADLADRADTVERRHAAIHRVLDHYLHSAESASECEDPARGAVALDPALPGVTPEHFDDQEQAITWCTTEHQVLLSVVGMAIDAHFDLHAWRLGWVLSRLWDRSGQWHDGVALQRMALTAVERLGDREGQARIHRSLARAYGWLGRHDEAEQHLQQAIEICAGIDDHIGQADGYGTLSWVFGLQDRHHDALVAACATLDLHRVAHSQGGEAKALNLIGWTYSRLGDHRKALAYCEQALALFESLGDRFNVALTYDSLGLAHHHLGQPTEAIASYTRALDLYRGFSHLYFEAETLDHLGDTHVAVGDFDAAGDVWRRALTILDDLGHSDAEHVRTKLDDLDRPGGARMDDPAVEPAGRSADR